MKILLLDTETSPNTAFVWGMFKENIPLARLIDSSKLLCWSAKWLGSDDIMFASSEKMNHKRMLLKIWDLLDEADVVIHYNGNRFDIPVLNKEFLLYGLTPPSPYKNIDLYRVVKQNFRFTSNKLDFVSQQLGLGKKKETDFSLWVKCMANDPEAWKLMEEYNKHDVILLEQVYGKLIPWIKGHANYSLHSEDPEVCPNCGEIHYQKRGFYFTNGCKYQRYKCLKCGTWFRDSKAIPNERSKVKFKYAG